ncbi:hypothetical protein J4Q44_G00087150, partial [Coregonus suidteri]
MLKRVEIYTPCLSELARLFTIPMIGYRFESLQLILFSQCIFLLNYILFLLCMACLRRLYAVINVCNSLINGQK